MSDMMTFPKTVDEFMEKYKIVDSDEVYTNGAELVPIFRMKQWFEHVDTDLVKHGHWEEENTRTHSMQFKCSACRKIAYYPQNHHSTDPKRCRYAYCPNCGAKMISNASNALDALEEEE